jgi:polysaccharide biosynthesis protein PslH
MKILFISRWFPYPPNNGAKLRILHLLQGAASQHEVFLLSFSDNPEKDSQPSQIHTICREVRTVLWKEYQPTSLQALLGLFSLEPRSLADTYSDQMAAEIIQIQNKETFDLVITTEWQLLAYRHLFLHQPVLFEELEMGVFYGNYRNATRLLARLRHGLTWAKHRLFLSRAVSDDQVCTVVSEHEKQLLAQIKNHNRSIHVIPNGVMVKEYADIHAEPQPNQIIFTGSFRYFANYEAAVWFIKEVFPLIQAQVPQAALTITGDPAGLKVPANRAVRVAGFVDDVRPYIARATVSIAPLQIGGGTRLKILEAMAIGTPVVSTSKGAEGLDAQDGHNILIADRPDDFARCVVSLFRDAALCRQLAQNAKQLVQSRYDWDVIMPEFLKVVALAASPQGRQAS